MARLLDDWMRWEWHGWIVTISPVVTCVTMCWVQHIMTVKPNTDCKKLNPSNVQGLYVLVWFRDNMRQDTQVSTFTWSDLWTDLCCHWPLLRLTVDCRISCWVAVYCINSYYWMFTLNISPLHSLEEVPHPSTHTLSTHFVYLWLVIVLMYVYVHTKIVMSSLSTLLLYLVPLMAAVCTHASVLVWCKQYTTCIQDIICLHKGFPISQGVWVSSATPDIIFRYPHKISLNSWQAAVEKCLN